MKITYAYLETTTYCNLKCLFCNREDVITRSKHISLDAGDCILKKLSQQPIKEAKLMGLGEPFFHPKFDIILSKFKKIFPNCFVITATNCQYKIKKDFFERCLRHIDMLYLSIDGYKDTYEKFRPGATWKRLCKFLNTLSKLQHHNCKFVINYVVNKHNISDIFYMNELIKKYKFIKQLRLNIAQDGTENTTLAGRADVGSYTAKELAYLRDSFSENIMGKTPGTGSDCFGVRNGLYVTVDGDVKVCCMNTDTEPIGNIFDSELNEIFNSANFLKIKRGCLLDVPTAHCKNCSYKELSPLLEKLIG